MHCFLFTRFNCSSPFLLPSHKNVFLLAPYSTSIYRIFAIAPNALGLYSFREDLTEGFDSLKVPDQVFTLEAFQLHAKVVVKTLEQALLTMLTGDQNKLKELSQALTELGTRHVGYGVHPAHFRVVEAALLRTLAAGLGEEAFTPELRKSWAAIFKFLSKAMIEGSSSRLEIVRAAHMGTVADVQEESEALLEQVVKLRLTMIIPPTKTDISYHKSPGSGRRRRVAHSLCKVTEREIKLYGGGRKRFLQSTRSDSNLVAKRRSENCKNHISVLDFQFEPKSNLPSIENSFRDLDTLRMEDSISNSSWSQDLKTTHHSKSTTAGISASSYPSFDQSCADASLLSVTSTWDNETFSTLMNSRAALWGEERILGSSADNAPRLPGSRRKSYTCVEDTLNGSKLECLQVSDLLPKVPRRTGSMGGRNTCRMRRDSAQMDPPRKPRRMVREDIEGSGADGASCEVVPPQMPMRRVDSEHSALGIPSK